MIFTTLPITVTISVISCSSQLMVWGQWTSMGVWRKLGSRGCPLSEVVIQRPGPRHTKPPRGMSQRMNGGFQPSALGLPPSLPFPSHPCPSSVWNQRGPCKPTQGQCRGLSKLWPLLSSKNSATILEEEHIFGYLEIYMFNTPQWPSLHGKLRSDGRLPL